MVSFIEIDRLVGGIVTIRVDSIQRIFISNKLAPTSEHYYCGIKVDNEDSFLINETYEDFLQRIAQGKFWIST